ncbi:MAG: uroporphyrinogen-III synthase [SAR86 cluster bacterium]|uniref:Uroporphyrinogen-III synthase n=1 Tax=SAR86 cluster bacterium TaxID=2030880 RepID=A0A2A5B9X1_9GAMM|nr:MAG: uroporphyrinogen-III synthase [SAR86 cluster bacterium]
MIADSLADVHVLITRPAKQQESLRAAIEAAGGKVLSLPLIDIQPLQLKDEIQAVRDKVQSLDSYQILIFVSSNAARFGAELIASYWPQFPLELSVVATGPSTASSLHELLDCDVILPSCGMTSEDVLELPLLNDVKDKKIGIVRGNGGRELMAETLLGRGAQVDYLEAYTRVAIDYDTKQFNQQLETHRVNVLTVTSSESLNRLQLMLADNKEEMSLLPLLVPSERVAQQARAAGFSEVVNANGADTVSFLAALELIASSK